MGARLLKPKTLVSVLGISTILLMGALGGETQAGFEWLPDGQTPYSDTPEPDPALDSLFDPAMKGTMLPPMGSDGFIPMPGTAATQMPAPASGATEAKSGLYSKQTSSSAAGPQKRMLKPLLGTAQMSAEEEMSFDARRAVSTNQNQAPLPLPVLQPIQNKSRSAEASTTQTPRPVSSMQPLLSSPQKAPSSQPDDVVQGFGSDMPLALALRQVVPPSYAFSFGDDVNAGYRVSWDGGKPWNQVVNDMIAPLGLVAVIRGKQVIISKGNGQATKTANLAPIPVASVAPAPQPVVRDVPPPPQFQPIKTAAVEAFAPIPAPAPVVIPEHKPLPPIEKMPRISEAEIKRHGSVIDPAQERRKPSPLSFERAKHVLNPQNIEPSSGKNKTPDTNKGLTPIPTLLAEARENSKEEQSHRPTGHNFLGGNMISDGKFALTRQRTTNSSVALPVEIIQPRASVPPPKAGYNKPAENENTAGVSINPYPAQDVAYANLVPLKSPTTGTWQATRGESLHATLSEWSNRANVSLVWNTNEDYTLLDTVTVSGDMTNAVKAIQTQGLSPFNQPNIRFQETPNGKALVVG